MNSSGKNKDKKKKKKDKNNYFMDADLFEKKEKGYTYQHIVDELNSKGYTNKSGGKWSISSVQVILGNEQTYRGMYKYGKEMNWVKGVHEPILKKD